LIFVLSRAWVLIFAATAFAIFGIDHANAERYGNSPFVNPFAGLGDALLAVSSRWDSLWYLGIANDGYRFNADSYAFFPLFPLLARGLGGFVLWPASRAQEVFYGGLLLSLAAFAGALYFLHRLVALERDESTATLAVALLAFFPMAIFYSAIYSESLFLLGSVAAVWFARTDRWALAGLCGGATAATRSLGALILVPLVLIYLLGPRGAGSQAKRYLGLRWRNRDDHPRNYPLRPDVLWLLLVPAGVLAYMAYLWIDTGDAWRFGAAQALWGREMGRFEGVPVGPLAGLLLGTSEAIKGVGELFSSGGWTLWTPDGGHSLRPAGQNVEAFVFLLFAIVAAVGVLRRLPIAYGAYAIALLAFPLALPTEGVPLFSFPRFVAVVFPFFIWLAIWIRERHWETPALAISALGLALYSAQWATWQWVA
jgi:hypothetical protein